ncbi:hypothetical protein MKX08_004610 [Trichoderma sp. CBMAI-0020]|nr:hypothetical protein MKX08_004610 [Trichoderma sp. CBMAI-0020]
MKEEDAVTATSVFETWPKDQLHNGDRKRDPKKRCATKSPRAALVTAPALRFRAQTAEANSALAAAAPPAPMSTLAGPFVRPGC